MVDGRTDTGLHNKLDDILENSHRDKAIETIEGLLLDEYKKLEAAIRPVRKSYLSMNVDDPAQQNAMADLRLEATEACRPAHAIEDYLAGLGVDVISLMPRYPGDFDVSSGRDGKWSLSVVSLKENAMRTLGGHCNVIGNVLVLERLLYDHTYLAAVMKLTDDYEPGKPSYVELDSYTVVFDEDIQALVKVPFDAGR